MLLFDKLKQAKENVKVDKTHSSDVQYTEEIILSDDYSEPEEYEGTLEIQADPEKYGLSEPEAPKPECLIGIDPDEVVNSALDHSSVYSPKDIEDYELTVINSDGLSINNGYTPREELKVVDLTDPEKDNPTTTIAPVFSKPTCTKALEFTTVTTTEDTSGKTESNVAHFLEKYAEGNDAIQVLRYDLMKILSDMHWIKESGNENEQFSLDFADALNEISVSI